VEDEHPAARPPSARFVPRWEVGAVAGAVVVVDVLRAFTTAAYALAAGARHVFLVDDVDEALAMKAAHPGTLAMGEDHGRRPPGFDLSNSPVEVAAQDLEGRVLVQRTSAGTRGVVAARNASRLWCASLVCASATARALSGSGLGPPTYVISGRFEDAPHRAAADDLATAELIERARLGRPLDAAATAERVAASEEAARTLALGGDDVHADDVAYATRVDAFGFAMEVTRTAEGLRLAPVPA
jgi:2-phosphosulfolactate phosphatase